MNATKPDTDRAEKFLLFMLSLVKERKLSTYPGWIFYIKGDKVLFGFDTKSKIFLVHYDKIWSVFERKYGLEYQQIQALVKKEVENALKLDGIIPFSRYSTKLSGAEKALKLKGITSDNL